MELFGKIWNPWMLKDTLKTQEMGPGLLNVVLLRAWITIYTTAPSTKTTEQLTKPPTD